MKTSLAVAAAILLAVAILNVPVARAQNDPAFDDPALAAAASRPVEAVAPADVLKMLADKRADIVLVDTQPTSGFADAHIPGAVNYPWAMQIKTFPIPLPRNKTLIFYGSCPNDTSDTVKKLAEFGYFNVKIMDGGLEKWTSLKYPVAGASGNQPSPDLSQLVKPAAATTASAK